MDSAKAENTRYKIEMKICEPKKMTERGDWFTHDTSKIDFSLLRSEDINCDKYFDMGPGESQTYNKQGVPVNKFEFANQIFAWEKVLVFRISDWSSRGWHPEMYVVIPMKYKSFVTRINLTDLEFTPGKVIFLTNFTNEQKGMYLTITHSLKDHNSADVKDFLLKKILEQ